MAFEGLRLAAARSARRRRRWPLSITISRRWDRRADIANEESRIQIEALAKHARDLGIEYFDESPRAGLHPSRHHHCVWRQPHLDAAMKELLRSNRANERKLGPEAKESMRKGS